MELVLEGYHGPFGNFESMQKKRKENSPKLEILSEVTPTTPCLVNQGNESYRAMSVPNQVKAFSLFKATKSTNSLKISSPEIMEASTTLNPC